MSIRPSSFDRYNLFFFDCETGGLSPYQADMVEVAAVLTDPTGKTVLKEFSAKVFPKKPVGEKAAAINGYTQEKWAQEAVELDGPMFEMITMARNAIFVAHNAPFDWGFFEMAMAQRAQRWPSDYHRYCTVALSMPLLRHNMVPNLKLATLAPFFDIKNEHAHTALSDVRACRELYVKLMEIYDSAMLAFKNRDELAQRLWDVLMFVAGLSTEDIKWTGDADGQVRFWDRQETARLELVKILNQVSPGAVERFNEAVVTAAKASLPPRVA